MIKVFLNSVQNKPHNTLVTITCDDVSLTINLLELRNYYNSVQSAIEFYQREEVENWQ